MPIALVILSGFLHAIWNVIAKHSRNKVAFLISIQAISLTVFLGTAYRGFLHTVWTTQTIVLFMLSMLFHGVYFVLLSKAYSRWDISQVYPIIRGTSSLIVPLTAIFFLQERLAPMGWMGVVSIVGGIFLLSELKFNQSALEGPLWIALGIGACVSGYIVIDKLAIQYSDPLTVNWVSTLGNILALSLFIEKKALKIEWQANKRWMLAGSILAPLSYIIFLFACQQGQIAQLSPIREIGTVFGTAFGIFILKEKKGKRRIFASILITTGILLLGLNRG